MLLEEFKNCLSSDIKTHLDKRKANDLHQAAVWVDDYAQTHKGSFNHYQGTIVIENFQLETEDQLQGTHFLLDTIRVVCYPKMVCLQGQFATTVSVAGMSSQNAKSFKRKMPNQCQ